MPHPFDNVLACEGDFPLTWSNAEGHNSHECSQINQRNERLLSILHTMDESRKEPVEEKSDQSVHLMRIEAKLDLMIDLVAQLLSAKSVDLKACPVRLSAMGIEWLSDDITDLRVSQLLWISLHLDPVLPQPVKLLSEVISVSADQGKERIVARFKSLSPAIRDLMEKTIFRFHRRQIAMLKSAKEAQKRSV